MYSHTQADLQSDQGARSSKLHVQFLTNSTSIAFGTMQMSAVDMAPGAFGLMGPPRWQGGPTLPSSRALKARKSRVACSGSISSPHSGSAVPSTGTGLPPLTSWNA